MKRIRHKDIAEALAVDASTVSLALRGDPRVAGETRRRVEAKAAELGYQRDPALSALAETRWRSGDRRAIGNWALFSDQPPEQIRAGHLGEVFRLAESAGYAVEVISLREETGVRRVNRELRAKGVRGIILMPIKSAAVAEGFDWRGLDWNQFSWVALNEARYAPPVHRVMFSPFHDTRHALRRLVEMGYRKIAFVHERSELSRVNVREHAAGLQFAAEHPEVDLRLYDVGATAEQAKVDGRFRPEVVLVGYSWLQRQLPKSWRNRPWATLARWEREAREAGIFLDGTALCREAVDLLDFLCRRRETGVPPLRKNLLIDSRWLDGETCPTKNP